MLMWRHQNQCCIRVVWRRGPGLKTNVRARKEKGERLPSVWNKCRWPIHASVRGSVTVTGTTGVRLRHYCVKTCSGFYSMVPSGTSSWPVVSMYGRGLLYAYFPTQPKCWGWRRQLRPCRRPFLSLIFLVYEVRTSNVKTVRLKR
jgi:hypothetical protein